MRKVLSKKYLFVAAIGLALAIPLSLHVLMSGKSSADDGENAAIDPTVIHHEKSMAVKPVSEISPELTSKFKVFLKSHTVADTPTVGDSESQVGVDIDEQTVRSTGMNTSLAKLVSSQDRVFAVPARGGICLAVSKGVVECGPISKTGHNFSIQTGGKRVGKGHVLVEGLVSDDVQSLRIKIKNGDSKEIAFANNYMSLRLPVQRERDLPEAVLLTTDKGEYTQRLSSPDMSSVLQ